MREKKFPQRIGSFLEAYFQKRGWQEKLKEYRIWTHWPDIVGPQLVDRSAPIRLKNNVLTIGVSSSSWMTQLQFMKTQIIEKISSELHVHLTDIKLTIKSADK